MPHMQQNIIRDYGYAVETETGTTYLPSGVCGNLKIRGEHDSDSPRFADLCASVRDCVEGRHISSVSYVPVCYWGLMSAPGYMDCTDWCTYSTIREARNSLADMYGE